MKNFLFYDDVTGEDFIVENLTKKGAIETAKEYFKAPHLIEEISDYEAESLGFDTY